MSTIPDAVETVYHGALPVGFIERAGPVFVALVGARYDRAVEIAQRMSREQCLEEILSRGRKHGAAPAPVRHRAQRRTKRSNRPGVGRAA